MWERLKRKSVTANGYKHQTWKTMFTKRWWWYKFMDRPRNLCQCFSHDGSVSLAQPQTQTQIESQYRVHKNGARNTVFWRKNPSNFNDFYRLVGAIRMFRIQFPCGLIRFFFCFWFLYFHFVVYSIDETLVFILRLRNCNDYLVNTRNVRHRTE